MSVDYSSVLIYGFKIPLTNDNCAAMWRATGGKEFWEYSDIIDEQFPEMAFITDNEYSNPDFGYFGVVIDNEIELDPTEVKGWLKTQEYEIPYAFNQFFGEEFYEQLGCPMLKLYHFVRPW
jgi:hypothetical protein